MISAKIIDQLNLTEYKQEKILEGRNNRSVKLTCKGKEYFVKTYFHSANDPRDRFHHEMSFYQYALQKGIDTIPQILASDPQNRQVVFEFIRASRALEQDDTKQFIQFFVDVNKDLDVQKIPIATDASFSIEQFIYNIQRRVKRFQQVSQPQELSSFYQTLISDFEERLRQNPFEDETISARHRCLNPSDFGFHNALAKNGKVYFFDFEYAGIDDPLKMICDFFCQADTPINMDYLAAFIDAVKGLYPRYNDFTAKVHYLLPLCRIKWCFIMLNDFLIEGNSRRQFANEDIETERLLSQLQKAQQYYKKHLEI